MVFPRNGDRAARNTLIGAIGSSLAAERKGFACESRASSVPRFSCSSPPPRHRQTASSCSRAGRAGVNRQENVTTMPASTIRSRAAWCQAPNFKLVQVPTCQAATSKARPQHLERSSEFHDGPVRPLRSAQCRRPELRRPARLDDPWIDWCRRRGHRPVAFRGDPVERRGPALPECIRRPPLPVRRNIVSPLVEDSQVQTFGYTQGPPAAFLRLSGEFSPTPEPVTGLAGVCAAVAVLVARRRRLPA